jgi:dUTP pyrophosphatase
MKVALKRLHPDAIAPRRMTEGAAGYDLFACVPERIVLEPRARALVGTGWAVAIPPGYEGQVRPRSGLAHRHGITLLNAPGTVDSDYRGELKVPLANMGSEPFTVEHGDRIAQMVFAAVADAQWEEVPELPAAKRGQGGFGSTGKR